MTPLPDSQRQRHEIAFTLFFEPPGKSRRRTPANWPDFEMATIRLTNERWTYVLAGRSPAKLSPAGDLWYKAVLNVMAISETPGRTTRATWYAEAARTGLAEAIAANDPSKNRDAKLARLRRTSQCRLDRN
jgi:hypothetical protein